MKIQYIYPFDLSQTPIDVDLDNDFLKFEVGTKGYTDSNKFLVSLWHQMNTSIGPQNSPDRIPWAYFPGRYIGKKLHVLVLGFAQTSIGEFYIALSCKKKGDIDSIHFHKITGQFTYENKSILNRLVLNACAKKNDTKLFLCTAHLIPCIKGIKISSYYTPQFQLYQSQDTYFVVKFNIDAIDKFEAEQIALELLYDFTAFLSVETNVYTTFERYYISNESLNQLEGTNQYFVNDYIDDFPIKGSWQLCISEYAIKFISDHIFALKRFEKRIELDRYFLSSCKHCQIAMECEAQLGEQTIGVSPLITFSLAKKNQKRKGENATSAMMSYLSALECVTATDANHETCPECGAVKYKIGNRVKLITSKYLGEYLGNVFYKLYGYRSKFLHAGRIATELNRVRTIPLLSDNSATNLIDATGFSVNVNGSCATYSIKNIHEWTSYVLRCFYQEKILGRSEFLNVFNDGKPIIFKEFPIKIYAPTPAAAKLLHRILVPVNISKNKIKLFIEKLKYLIKRNFKL